MILKPWTWMRFLTRKDQELLGVGEGRLGYRWKIEKVRCPRSHEQKGFDRVEAIV